MGNSIRDAVRAQKTEARASPTPRYRAPEAAQPLKTQSAIGPIILGILFIALILWAAIATTKFAYHLVFGWPEPAKAEIIASPAVPEPAPPRLSEADAREATETKHTTPQVTDHSGSASYQKEWYMVKGLVRQSGGLCASVAYVEPQLDGSFKAVCKAYKGTNKYTGWIIDPDAHTVEPYHD